VRTRSGGRCALRSGRSVVYAFQLHLLISYDFLINRGFASEQRSELKKMHMADLDSGGGDHKLTPASLPGSLHRAGQLSGDTCRN
jgi:hypothetical protein